MSLCSQPLLPISSTDVKPCIRHGNTRYACVAPSTEVTTLLTSRTDLGGFHAHDPLRQQHWDSLEKALTVFTLPASSPLYDGTRRRLDLIFVPPEVYWTAVLGW